MMRHSDIRISSDIRIGCRIVEKNEAVTGQKRSATTGNGFSHLCGRYINCHGQSGGKTKRRNVSVSKCRERIKGTTVNRISAFRPNLYSVRRCIVAECYPEVGG